MQASICYGGGEPGIMVCNKGGRQKRGKPVYSERTAESRKPMRGVQARCAVRNANVYEPRTNAEVWWL